MQIAAVHRRTGLAHLRREDLTHSGCIPAHGEGRAKVANQRRHNVAGPSTLSSPELRPAAETQRRGVNRFLSERSESLALERRAAVFDFAAGEELLQAVIHGTSQDHPAQHFETLVVTERLR